MTVLPDLAGGDLTVLPEEVPEFLRECAVVDAFGPRRRGSPLVAP
ncbi:hypothetical protein SK854_42475 [Lentzea sp. BCCO 10_0061]|uniref:Uncharacterized protein n=1 Tax=Lentzea sokolovensis TaxID=3095429 RepID=A0ABU4VAX5_9PSEU|nr:hypothetical protein [Lentzea sp. BCCO 10_0061]MDX8148844.1 hypothetical protein [Lentzea sp. BCCO 10_0061]